MAGGRERNIVPTRPMPLETPTKSMYQLTLNDLYKKYVMKKSKFLSSDNNSEIFAVNIDNQSI